MKVSAVTPTDAAASPSHPEHARWVKDQTLAREADHARAVGLSFRDAESTNTRLLERLDARRLLKKPRKPNKTPTKRQLKAANVTRGEAPVLKPAVSLCNYCGKCGKCKREMRVAAILTKARQGDLALVPVAWEIVGLFLACKQGTDYKDAIGRHYPFSILKPMDAVRARNVGIENACDRTVSMMGQWR